MHSSIQTVFKFPNWYPSAIMLNVEQHLKHNSNLFQIGLTNLQLNILCSISSISKQYSQSLDICLL